MLYPAPLFFNRHNKHETSILLPLRNVVLLPGITLPVVAGKPRSVAAVESAMLTETKQLIVTAIRPEARQRIKKLETSPQTPEIDEALQSKFVEVKSLEEIYKLLRPILTDLQKAIEVQKLQGQILGETKKEIDQQQKEFFLRQQLKKIQEELGDIDSENQEIAELRSRLAATDLPGIVANGLAWTLQGGEILFIEAVLLPQGQDLILTGQLGEVMQESAEIARSYVWSRSRSLGIDLNSFKANGLHIHVPSGAIPKDGPSAGITMVTAIASLLMDNPVRNDTAMTGEVNLSGEVLAIGGVREKVLAAHRAGIKRVLLPRYNEKDLVDVPADVRQQIEFV